MTPDLDARVAEAVSKIADIDHDMRGLLDSVLYAETWSDGEKAHREVVLRSCRALDPIAALLRDLHAALKAARGEETEAWAVCTNDGRVLGPHVGRAPRLHWIKAAAERACETIATARVERDLGLTVRRVLCRIAPDDGGEG